MDLAPASGATAPPAAKTAAAASDAAASGAAAQQAGTEATSAGAAQATDASKGAKPTPAAPSAKAGAGAASAPASAPPAQPGIAIVDDREQDKFLPIANISRIMKKALPPNAKVAKDAKETVQECVSEFISFITSEASDKCQREKRKTIMGDDLLWAMSTLGFENYTEPLKTYLFRYREMATKSTDDNGEAKTSDAS